MKKYLIAGIVAFTVALAGAASANAAFNANLSVGSTGADVSALQAWLISKGFAIPSISSGAAQPGYFGQQTKTAVIAYQASVGLPNTGFVGPLTRGILNGSSVPSTPSVVVCPVGYTCQANPGTTPSTSTGSLAGTDGSIESVDLLSQYSNEEVGDGQTDVKVAGFEVEASNDGDIALRSIKVVFDPTGNGSNDSDRLKDYIEGVTVWQGSTEVGSADVSDFTETSADVWTKTITLKNSVVRADKTEKFYISVDAISNFDSGDIDTDSWTVGIENIRFEDGSGVVSTETSIDNGILWNSTNDGVSIAFVDFSTAADTELKISKESSSPKAMIVVVDDQDDTDDVTLLVGKIKVEGTSDILVDEFPVTLAVSTATSSPAALASTLTLKIDGEEFSETVNINAAQTGSVTFDNLDLTLEAGKTYTFTVAADINDTNPTGAAATDFNEGYALLASVTATNRDNIDAENEEGDQLSSSEKTGTAIGEGQEFRTNGIGLTLVSTDTSVSTGQSANDDLGTFKIKFKVTAIGDTAYVSSLADAQLSGNTSGKTTVLVDRAGTATVGGVSVTLANITDTSLTSTGNYMIDEGESETFELTATVQLPTAGAAGQYRAALGGVRWGTTDVYPLTNSYTSELDTFKTSYVGLN